MELRLIRAKTASGPAFRDETNSLAAGDIRAIEAEQVPTRATLVILHALQEEFDYIDRKQSRSRPGARLRAPSTRRR